MESLENVNQHEIVVVELFFFFLNNVATCHFIKSNLRNQKGKIKSYLESDRNSNSNLAIENGNII